MQPVTVQPALCRRQTAYHIITMCQKNGATHLEAGSLISLLWPHCWVQNLAYRYRKLTAAHIRDTVSFNCTCGIELHVRGGLTLRDMVK